MAESPKTGQVHIITEGELEVPPGKRPKVINKTHAKRTQKRRDKVKNLPEPCSPEDVLWHDVVALLGQDVVDKALEEKSDFNSPFAYHQEVELEVSSLLPSGMLAELPSVWRICLAICSFYLRLFRYMRLLNSGAHLLFTWQVKLSPAGPMISNPGSLSCPLHCPVKELVSGYTEVLDSTRTGIS